MPCRYGRDRASAWCQSFSRRATSCATSPTKPRRSFDGWRYDRPQSVARFQKQSHNGRLRGEDLTMTQPAQSNGNGAKPHQEMISGAYLRNAWYVAAWSDGVGDGQLVPRTIMDEPIVLYRKADGAVAAIGDRCAHRFAPLSMGKIVGGDRIQCPYHGLEYDGSGACVRNPHGTKNIPPRARVKSYPVIEKHKAIWVWMGDQPADAGTIPDFSVLDNVPELHTTKRDSIVIKANYQLIIDNLLDLSHTSYLHEGILGNADTVESDITAEMDGDDVVVGRYATNSARTLALNCSCAAAG